MATDLSTIAGNLKRVYGEYQKMQNLKHRALDEIGKSATKYSPGGEGYFGAINYAGNESVGAINETENFRTIDNELYAQYKIVPKVIVGPIEFSGLVAAAANQDEEAFVSVVVDALDMAKERLMKDANRQFYGIGTGALASPLANAASNVTSFAVDSAQYLRANMVVDIFNGATKTVDSIRISDVDKVANVVYFATSIGVPLITTDVMVKENIRDNAPTDGKEMMGLRGIVDDGTELTTFENVNALTNRIWRGRRLDTAGQNLTSDLMQRLIDDIDVLSGESIDLLLLHQKQRRSYLNIVLPQRRYAADSFDAGFKKLSFNGMDLMVEEDCQDDRLYGINKTHLHKYELEALGMGKHEGSDTFLRKINADAFQAYWRWYCNFGTGKRNAHGALIGLSRPTGVA